MLVKTIAGWVDERLGVGREVGALLTKPIKGGAKYLFSLGSVNLFLFINQVVTGMLLMMYYAPTPDHAYDAVKYIQHDVPFGFIIRGLHYWGASAMVVCVMLHATRVYVYGAYKKPREIMWLSGVFLLLLVFGFAFTGYLLPWDQKAYWATVVGTNVAGTAPLVGSYLVRLMRGGAEISNLTLTRFFMLHTMLLPWLLVAIAGIHLTVLQLVDHTPPWDPNQARRGAPFYPDQVFKDAVLVLLVFILLMILASVAPAGLGALADPTDHSYNPRPEWYFYFLFQILHYTEGPFEVVGTMVLPNLFVLALLALPFIDKAPERSPKRRPIAMTAIGLVLAGYVALTTIAALSGPPTAIAKAPEPPQVIHGRQLFAKLGCSTCHAINGVGGKVGPALDHEGGKRQHDWFVGHFKDPQKFTPGSMMPKFDYLPAGDVEDLAQYMMSIK
jgi:ubiquinol-cytochrome c reductase cytochrome b subunit